MATVTAPAYSARASARRLLNLGLIAGAAIVVAVLVWQGITSSGNPDVTGENLSATALTVNAGILVFREGLEAILVLAALTASFVRTDQSYWKPVAIGSGFSFGATFLTWFMVVGIIGHIDARALDIQAGTGLLAIIVLLVIMNWFFHKIYWVGWITLHNRRRRSLTKSPGRSGVAIYRGLLLLGFTSVYREGFEVVLFLQSLRLRGGMSVVVAGAAIGLALTLVVAVLVFGLRYKLPHRKMLIVTGVMLGAVLLVMVGESVQEMQQAQWISTTTLPFGIPAWMNTWFALFPTAESLAAQAFAAALVIGSYYMARGSSGREAVPGAGDEGIGELSQRSAVHPES